MKTNKSPHYSVFVYRSICAYKTEYGTYNFIFPKTTTLITFANSIDPDQARQKVGPDLDPNWLIL